MGEPECPKRIYLRTHWLSVWELTAGAVCVLPKLHAVVRVADFSATSRQHEGISPFSTSVAFGHVTGRPLQPRIESWTFKLADKHSSAASPWACHSIVLGYVESVIVLDR